MTKEIQIAPRTFNVINRKTGAIVTTCKTRKGATRAADRRDNEYGAYIHRVIAA